MSLNIKLLRTAKLEAFTTTVPPHSSNISNLYLHGLHFPHHYFSLDLLHLMRHLFLGTQLILKPAYSSDGDNSSMWQANPHFICYYSYYGKNCTWFCVGHWWNTCSLTCFGWSRAMWKMGNWIAWLVIWAPQEGGGLTEITAAIGGLHRATRSTIWGEWKPTLV